MRQSPHRPLVCVVTEGGYTIRDDGEGRTTMLPQVEGPLGTAGWPRWPVGVLGVRHTTVLRGRHVRPFLSMSVRVTFGDKAGRTLIASSCRRASRDRRQPLQYREISTRREHA